MPRKGALLFFASNDYFMIINWKIFAFWIISPKTHFSITSGEMHQKNQMLFLARNLEFVCFRNIPFPTKKFTYLYLYLFVIYVYKYGCMHLHCIYIYMCISIYKYHIYVFMYISMYVFIYCIYWCEYASIFICFYVKISVSQYVHMCIVLCTKLLRIRSRE